MKLDNLSAINRLELEDYLAGVLPREVPASWPMAALQAQAVASRTYALHRIEQSGGLPSDVSADVLSQVYGGRSAESWRTSRAVKRTRGRRLSTANSLFRLFSTPTAAAIPRMLSLYGTWILRCCAARPVRTA